MADYETGIGIDELDKAVKNFYKSRENPTQSKTPQDTDLLFSCAPPTKTAADVDSALVDSVFDWLRKHPDITINDGRIFTNEERSWQAIAGHGVDHSRIPPKMFECLQVIAAHGPDGILQPDVRKITGQDKRSLPHRTDQLAAKGYITKEQVIAKSTNTTLLKLRRFAKDTQDLQHIRAYPASKVPATEEPMIKYDGWYDKMLELFRSNDNIIALSDLIVGVGIYDSDWHTRAFRRCYNRLVKAGLLRKVSARIEDDSNPAESEGYVVRCLQMVREPEDMDRFRFKKNAGPDRTAKNLALATRNAIEEEPEEDEDSEIEEINADGDMPSVLQQRVSPQWNPDLPHNNTIYNIIHAAGPDGISSMDLNEAFTGIFWRRPLDDLMLRLTDIWQHAQPSHLKHLSIVRDTGLHGKASHFIFRSMANFEKAVEMGQTSWKAVGGPHGTTGKGKKISPQKQTELDAWGFPVLKKHLFEGNGYASLLECQALARKGTVYDDEKSIKRSPKRKIDNVAFEDPMEPPITSTTSTLSAKSASIMTAPSTSGTTRKYKRSVAVGVQHFVQYAPRTTQDLHPTARSEQLNKRSRAHTEAPDGSSSLEDVTKTKPDGLRGYAYPAPHDTMASAFAAESHQTPVKVQINPFGSYPTHLIKRGRRKRVLVAVFEGVKWDGNTIRRAFPPPLTTPSTINTAEPTPRQSSAMVPTSDIEREQLLSAFRPRTHPDPMVPRQISTTQPAISQQKTTTHGGSSLEQPAPFDLMQTPNGVKKRPRADTASIMAPDEHAVSADGPPQPQKRAKRGAHSNLEIVEREALQQMRPADASSASRLDLDTSVSQQIQKPTWAAAKDVGSGASANIRTPQDLEDGVAQPLLAVGPLVKPLPTSSHIPHDVDNAVNTSESSSKEASPADVVSSPGQAEQRIPAMTDLTIDDPPLPPAKPRGPFDQEQGTMSTLPVSSRISSETKSFGGELLSQKPSLTSSRAAAIANDTMDHTLNRKTQEEDALPRSGIRDESANGITQGTEPPTTPAPVRDTSVEDRSLIVKLPISGKFTRQQRLNRSEGNERNPGDADSEYDDLPELFPVDVPELLDSRPRNLVKAGTSRYGGSMQLHREKLALDIVHRAGGATAGDLQISHVYSKVWQALYKQTPDRKTVENAINSAIASRMLRKFGFVFKDGKGDTIQRHVIMDRNVSPTSSKARAVQQEIMNAPSARFLPSTNELESDMCAALPAGERAARNETPIVHRQPSARMDSDPDFSPPSSAPKRSSVGNSYHVEFPTIAGITVKRTSLGIAAGQAEERFWKKPRKSSNIRRTVFRGRRQVKGPSRTLADSLSDDSGDDEDDDEAVHVEPDQAAGMGTFVVDDYEHDPYDIPERYKAPRPKPTFFRDIPAQIQTANAARHSRQDSEDSETDFETGIITTNRTLPKAHRTISPTEWMQLSLQPDDLQSILERAHSLGYVPASGHDSLFWQFQMEVDSVMLFELALLNAGRELQCSKVGLSIDHGLNRKHIVAPQESGSEPLKIDFVEGSLAVGKAEKLRSNPKPRKRLRGATTFDFSQGKLDRQFRNNFTSLPKGGKPILGMLSFDTSTQLPASPLPPPASLNGRQPSTTLFGLSPSHRTNNGYNTRFAGEGHSSLNNLYEDNDSDVALTTRAKTVRRNKGVPREERKLLAVALALINVLCGGADGDAKAKWELVSHCHSFKQEANNCRQRWKSQSRSEFGVAFVAKTENAIREPFLMAYERGELPRVNFTELNKTDWPALTNWVLTKVLNADEGRPDTLPLSRVDLEDIYEVNVNGHSGDTASMEKDSVIPTLDLTVSAGVRSAMACSSILEKSWIRALLATKEESYDEAQATQKLANIPEHRLQALLKEMTSSKSIMHVHKGRQQPGRNFVFHKHFLSQFERWPGPLHADGFLVRLANAWTMLAEHFRSHDKLDLKREVSEAESTVLDNLLANGRVRIAPVLPAFSDKFNAPVDTLSKWGMGGYSHKPKTLEDSVFRLPVVYAKTASFRSDHGLKVNVKFPTYPSGVLGESGIRIPLWIDIHGNFNSEIWKMVLRSVLYLIVYRPGCTPASMEKAHDHMLWAWEIELVIEWMEEVGIAERFAGGWKAAEWWFCAFLPEVT